MCSGPSDDDDGQGQELLDEELHASGQVVHDKIESQLFLNFVGTSLHRIDVVGVTFTFGKG